MRQRKLIILLFIWPSLLIAEPEMTEGPSGPSSGFSDLDDKCPINMPLLDFYKCMEKEKNEAQGDQCKMQAIRCHIKQRRDFAASTCAQVKDPAAYWECFQNNVKDQAVAQNPNINLPVLLSFLGLASSLANNGGTATYPPNGGDSQALTNGGRNDGLLGDSTYNPYSDPNSDLYNQDVVTSDRVSAAVSY